MKELDAAFIAAKNKQLIKTIRLYTVVDYDGEGNDLRFAEYTSDVTFDSLVYQAFPITFVFVTEKTQGEVDQVQLRVSNVSRLIEAYLQQYNLREKQVKITYVHADHLDDPDNKYEESWHIDSYTTNVSQAIFILSSILDVRQVALPLRTVNRNVCGWASAGRFKGIECKYAGPETVCDGTLQQCRAYQNIINYGAFPASGGKRMFA